MRNLLIFYFQNLKTELKIFFRTEIFGNFLMTSLQNGSHFEYLINIVLNTKKNMCEIDLGKHVTVRN